MQEFGKYIVPIGEISEGATRFNGLEKRDGELYKNNQHVAAFKSMSLALDAFCGWLTAVSPLQKVVLAAHNGARFDEPILRHNANKEGRLTALKNRVAGYIDTLPVFRAKLPNLKGHNLSSLAKELNVPPGEHDAVADSRCLQSLAEKAGVTRDELMAQILKG